MPSHALPLPTTFRAPPPLGETDAWQLLLELRENGVGGTTLAQGEGLALDAGGRLHRVPETSAQLIVDFESPCSHRRLVDATPEAAQALDLFFPLCSGETARNMVVAHLAQSLDGRIATNGGDSKFISGQEDLKHTHRLRALFDAVVVGVQTAIDDDPRLTTRLAPGPNCTRVILDPRGILPRSSRVLNDGAAETIVVTANEKFEFTGAHVSVIAIDLRDGRLDLADVLSRLSERGLHRVFVEGGGVTVSRFLEASLLDRLHIAVAPSIFGSGRASFGLQPIDDLSQQLRLNWRHFSLGSDLLLDCTLLAR